MSIDFHKLRVAEVKRETPDAVSVRFELPEELREAFKFRAGQHLTFRREIGGEELRRNYSVCVSPSEGMLKIGVKKIAGGAFSGWVNDMLKAGDVMDVMAPHGSFCWAFDETARREYAAFAGGSGITPVLSLLKTALAMEPHSRFTLFYGNRNSPGVMFLEEIAGLKDRYLDRLSVFHFLEEEEEEIELFNGRLDRTKVEEVLSTVVRPQNVDAFFICGPGPMMDAVEEALIAKGVDKPRILIERFTTGPLSAAQAAAARALEEKAAGLKMSVTLNGRRVQVAFDPEKHSILDNVRGAGLPAPFACKGGVCATCRAKVTAGEVSMKVNYGLSEQELAEGYVLTCQATPLTEGVALTYDA
ncbi:1,2-phenylacetyl-CoA epoxidase subunit PaaE [Terricaulis silvestris]|uniref:1,2-phenylacetyl-CoA epoxidase, subunit E n=1 Tax=Terricaulis silvestris TaxID=2686094 RepID=A0A6I6MKS5_9CAUL|nr:1,2-phenylacetyl-CoA epoxidase subunit PaaE [Terricaulis silvestris]QGZ93838.1 1,2-phenylacetyl-CoA epoxidase, subunit E [Terricaulis silvestris]